MVNRFQRLIFRLKIYKNISKNLYEIVWDQVVNYLNFCHHQFEFTIENDENRINFKTIDLSKFSNNKGWKISFINLKKTPERRRILMTFAKDGIEKFKEDIGYCVGGKNIFVKKDDPLSRFTVKSIIDLISMIEDDSPDYRIRKLEMEA